ncbi:hypothetical protein DFH08DRAFT_1075557 [Mycena albidolilacea]|uniref:Uncharacterized protein n=1 Tax=Mycena albidolilacea TaxID=1033008 RepID=A0AAD7F0D3_9AGAR|nr:hypothetical protein DFH08DRAFT_1075557 [Mycena albidolilacea]
MADHLWLPLGLSSRAKALSEAVADLRSSLPAELLATSTVKSKLELLESEIFSLRSAVIPPNSFHPSHATPAIKQLAQRAHETLWDDIPLHAIRNAHEVRAKELTDTDEDGEHTAEIYVAYYKFLQLRNHGLKDDPGPEYRKFLHLERFLCAGSATDPNGKINGAIPAPAHSISTTVAPVSSGLSMKTTSHPGGKAEKNLGRAEKSLMLRLGAMVKH